MTVVLPHLLDVDHWIADGLMIRLAYGLDELRVLGLTDKRALSASMRFVFMQMIYLNVSRDFMIDNLNRCALSCVVYDDAHNDLSRLI